MNEIDIPINVELGEHGLYYGTSPAMKGLLVTGDSVKQVMDKVPSAIAEMREATERHKSVMTLERIEANANLTLWCVHILGPDDVIPMPSHEAAVERAHELNLSIHERAHEPNDLMCFAYAAPWPHDNESHAEHLKENET